jgi:hypothetical protein
MSTSPSSSVSSIRGARDDAGAGFFEALFGGIFWMRRGRVRMRMRMRESELELKKMRIRMFPMRK